MGLFNDQCPECGKSVKKGAKFCGGCGAKLGGGTIECTHCGAKLKGDASFCNKCGAPVRDDQTVVRNNTWSRLPDQFAVRIETDDVKGFFSKGVVVEPGCRAMFVIDGRSEGVVGPGKYDMGGLFQRIKTLGAASRTTALVVAEHDVEIPFRFKDVYTSDPVGLNFECTLILRVDDPATFIRNQMHGKNAYTMADLKGLLFGETQQTLINMIAAYSAEQLNTASMRDELELAFSRELTPSLDRNGLAFVRLKIASCHHERLDQVRKVKEENYLLISEEEAQLEGKKRLFDVVNADELENIRQEEARVQNYDRSIAVRKQAIAVIKEDVTNEDDLDAFMLDKGLGKAERDMLGQDQLDELENTLLMKGDARELAREHFRLRMEQENEIDLLRRNALASQKLGHEISDNDLEHEISQSRKTTDAELEDVRKRLVAALENEKDVHDETLRRQRVEFYQGLEMSDAAFEQQTKHREEEHKRDMEEASDALDLLDKMKAGKRKDEEEQRRIAREDEVERSRVADELESNAHGRELERMNTMAQMSTEALIAMADDGERAAMLADLQKTEALKGMSEEQILAMAAGNSPHVAQAFQEKFRAAADSGHKDEMMAMYQKMLEDQQRNNAQQGEMQMRYAQMMQEMFNKGMDTQRDTASTAASTGGMNVAFPPPGTPQPVIQGPAIVQPGVGAAPAQGTPPAEPPAKVIICPSCRGEVEADAMFCDNCGHKIRG